MSKTFPDARERRKDEKVAVAIKRRQDVRRSIEKMQELESLIKEISL